jgi:hypothetical protein
MYVLALVRVCVGVYVIKFLRVVGTYLSHTSNMSIIWTLLDDVYEIRSKLYIWVVSIVRK